MTAPASFVRLDKEAHTVFAEMKKLGKHSYARFNQFQNNIALGQPNNWRCRAGSRYLYICENGLVHYCSQQRGLSRNASGRIHR